MESEREEQGDETDFRERRLAARDRREWQNRADIDLEEPGSRSRSCLDAESGWGRQQSDLTVHGGVDKLLRRATELPALPQSWKDYLQKRLWDADS
jgi:YiiM-like, 3-alpha helix domain